MPIPLGAETPMPLSQAGGRRHGASVKALKRVLKKAGLKTSGRKAALTRRAKKAHLLRGGAEPEPEPVEVPVGSPPGGEPMGENPTEGGASVKTLKRALKKAGLKTSGRKSTLTKRAKKAGIRMRGGNDEPADFTPSPDAGLSNVTPPQGPAPTELPEWAKEKGGRHRRGHRSRKH